ncbi:MAG: hypothetical protein D6762_02755 [Candidatus Neomarinimicrobiota bacterium]|nr:MAG: hypothetical protein D6762_02755 [Candidatus Neomarinimicrobiota bacterium]
MWKKPCAGVNSRGIPSLHLLGIFGKREDHALANHLLLIRYSHRIRLQAYSHRFLIEPLSGSHRRHSRPGQLISCLDPEGKALLTTRGLEYELKGESLGSPSRGVSNRARETSFQITVDGPPILLFQEL